MEERDPVTIQGVIRDVTIRAAYKASVTALEIKESCQGESCTSSIIHDSHILPWTGHTRGLHKTGPDESVLGVPKTSPCFLPSANFLKGGNRVVILWGCMLQETAIADFKDEKPRAQQVGFIWLLAERGQGKRFSPNGPQKEPTMPMPRF